MKCQGTICYNLEDICFNYLIFINSALSENKEEIKNVSCPENLELFLRILEKEAIAEINCKRLDKESFVNVYNTTLLSDMRYAECNKSKNISFKERLFDYINIR